MTELIIICVLAILVPITSISAFIIGFNLTADRKIAVVKKKKKAEKSEEEILLERIEKAHV